MKLLGLTGGIGMGKSTAAQWLRENGIPVTDTDEIAREVVEPGQPALAEIRRDFGPEYLDAEGRLRRDAMAKKVFADASARQRLEAILHPRIRETWQARVGEWRSAGHPVGVVVIPLLFETGAEKQCDAVLCVACSAVSQWARLAARGWSAEEIRRRLASQQLVETKMARAHYVLWTEGEIAVLAQQLELVLRRAAA
ncbi:MAG: dephospho-CoA kinase [Verrucomicrobiota bacterium]